MVPKKDGTKRPTIDYRELNLKTIKNAYPLPRLEDCIDRLAGSEYYSSLDLVSGYWQVKVKEEDIPKTAFSCTYGHFEFLVMPFGLCNAPATFKRLMNSILRDILDKCVTVYLDDITVYSQTKENHARHLLAVCERLDKAGLVINQKKSFFAKRELQVLGHICNGKEIKPLSDKVERILIYKTPETITDVCAFLNFAGYYCKFIKNFAKICKPIYDLTAGNLKPKSPIE